MSEHAVDFFPHWSLATCEREQLSYRKYLSDALADGRQLMRVQAEHYAAHLDKLALTIIAKKTQRHGGRS